MTSLCYTLVLYTYNQAKSVRAAAKTVLAQDCPPIDILFSDDCSQDETFSILQELAASYKGPHRLHLNRNARNLGVIEHIHKVFELTDSDVIINCAGDDLCRSDRAACIIETFQRERPLLVCSHAKVQYADGSAAPRGYAKANFYHRRDALSASDSMQLYLGATSAWHRDIFLKFGPVQFKDCFEDLVYGFRAALAGRVAVIDEELVTYRVGGGVTNAERPVESELEIKARRKRELTQEISVLLQRRMDALTYGLPPGHPIMRRLSNALSKREIRLGYVDVGVRSLLGSGLDHPLRTLGAGVSENRRWRKARRNR